MSAGAGSAGPRTSLIGADDVATLKSKITASGLTGAYRFCHDIKSISSVVPRHRQRSSGDGAREPAQRRRRTGPSNSAAQSWETSCGRRAGRSVRKQAFYDDPSSSLDSGLAGRRDRSSDGWALEQAAKKARAGS